MVTAEQSGVNDSMIQEDVEGERKPEEVKGCRGKAGLFLRHITVEPLLALYLMPGILGRLAVTNLNLEKACLVNLNYSRETCAMIANQSIWNSTEEAEMHKIVALMETWRGPLYAAIPCILILFIGAWSDRTMRRKPCFMFPISGEIVTSIGLILCTYYFLEWPMEVAGVIEALPPALTGGAAAVFLGVYSYLTDITTPDERTFRIGVLNTFVSISMPVGLALSGILLHTIGFYGIFTISLVLQVIAFLYGYFRIQDIGARKDKAGISLGTVAEFFSWRHVYETFHIVFRERKSNRRRQTIFTLLAYILLCGAVHGANNYQYLYARRSYQFNEVDFSIFGAYGVAVNFVGVLFAVSVFSRYLHMSDYMLGALGCMSKVLGSFVYALAPSKGWFFLGPLVELIGGTAAIAMRSVVTKVVEQDEVGKINSVMGVTETAVNILYGPIFSAFYYATVSTFPGAFCLLSAALTVPSIIILLYLWYLEKQDKALMDNELKNMNTSHID